MNLSKELAKMFSEDQKMRNNVERGESWNYLVDRKNTARLKEIIAEFGWPTINLVGKKGSRNAWLLAQHADEDRSFQYLALKLMKKIYKKDPSSLDPANIAYLTDRLLVAGRKKQEFGTQFYINNRGKLVLSPLKNPKTVNKRREKYNLGPIEKDLKDAEKYIPPIKKSN